MGHRPDEKQPVGCDEKRRCKERREVATRRKRRTDVAPTPRHDEQERREKGGPDDAMRKDLEHGNPSELLPVHRKQAPAPVGAQGVQHSSDGRRRATSARLVLVHGADHT